MTATQLIYGALRLLGVLRPGMTANTASLADGLVELNDLLDNWNTDRLKVFDVGAQAFALTGGQQTYTIGAGGNFNTARPVKLDDANLITNYGGQLVRTPVQVLNKDQWASITVQAVPSPIPYALYCDFAFPLANIKLYPFPSDSSAQLELYLWQQLTQFATLTTSVNFPPGYALALRFNLAVQMAPSFAITAKSNPNLDMIIAQAKEYRAAIESLNAPAPVMSVDRALMRHGESSVYNWIANI